MFIYQEGCKPASVTTSTTSYSCTKASFTLTSTAQSLISDAVWSLTGLSNLGVAKTYYNALTSDKIWAGKVALMYPSDYFYATSGGSTTSRNTCLSSNGSWRNSEMEDCKNNNWLYQSSYYDWTLMKHDGVVFTVDVRWSSGDLSYSLCDDTDKGVRPVVFLSHSVKIASGVGSSSNPYVLSN